MPTAEAVDRAVSLLHQSANYQYFFEQLESPAWIEPLHERGFFRNPPGPIRDGDYIRFPVWVESRFLARVAPEAPEVVARILLELPPTENTRVHEDIADAACRMPIRVAASLAPRVAGFLDAPHHLLLPEKVRDLATILARGGEVDESVALAKALLQPAWTESRRIGDYPLPPNPRPRFSYPEYADVLAEVLSPIQQADPSTAYRLTTELLEASLSSSAQETGRSEDFSHIWRPAIEDSPRNFRHSDIRSDLVDAARDLAERLEPGPDVIDDLERRERSIFQRLALHVIRLRSSELEEVPRNRAFDTKRLLEPDQYHEFVLLLRHVLARMAGDDKDALVDEIVATYRVDESGARDDQRHNTYRLARTLVALKPVLPESGRQLLDQLIDELDLSEDAFEAPDFLTSDGGGVWVGPTSPMSIEEILSTRDSDLVRYLVDWEAPNDWRAPSPEGLGRSLQAAVKQAPERFSAIAGSFVGLDPTYVRSLLQGLGEAAREGHSLFWGPTLEVGLWVLRQTDPEPTDTRDRGIDPGWSWTRRALADLLDEGLVVRDNAIPLALRDTVWALLSRLLDDPDPTPEHEAQYGGSNMDPVTLAINTVRGEAFHALVRYMLWVRSSLNDGNARGLVAMPEAFEALDRHLDRDREPSLAVRSGYGQFFPWLHLVDPDWAESSISAIFPPEPEAAPWFTAAWDAYIVFTQPFDRMAGVLRDVYAEAIERLPHSSEEGRSRHDPGHHLAEHIAVFVARGVLALDDDLVDRFFMVAPAELRAHVHEFLGRSFQSVATPDEAVSRGMKLWDARLAASRGQATEQTKELESFGWWFDAGALDADWRITNLLEVLRITSGRVDFPSRVLDELANLFDQYPSKVLAAVRQIIRGVDEGWEILAGRDQIRRILVAALGDPTTREPAEALAHELGARGYADFRSVLDE